MSVWLGQVKSSPVKPTASRSCRNEAEVSQILRGSDVKFPDPVAATATATATASCPPPIRPTQSPPPARVLPTPPLPNPPHPTPPPTPSKQASKQAKIEVVTDPLFFR
ncbi:hypothetical protein ONS95_013088 [Cadophora gregata]|uniref:uncharacterized protein n=1 Tax=Cadophora gregata TaxID=51156 RepID=UPI0026DB0F75|nr:uncharacterized protein ONS95_013088 [Cadophora gregata]KAK0116053.1 hypothetical protein ONS95_013088 [Cadophora gregata]